MKIQIFSDLHLDVARIKPITISKDVSLVIAAGDTCEGALKAFEHLRRIVPMTTPIVMVMGNHEYYRRFVPVELALAKQRAPSFNIHLLENDSIIIRNGTSADGIRIAGATLWTDYAIFGAANVAGVMNACATGMNDHRLIGWQKQPWLRFRPHEAALLHHRSKAFLTGTLATPFNGPTLVVTHHAPHWDSVHPRFQSDPVTGAYVSDLSALIETYQPDLWVHGHVHNSSDYLIGRTHVIANPHGYGNENPDFNGELVVEIGP
ncbi:MAG TPA: metallophosphoesterase [Sphingobium sp.]|uniref:metallophosphoesterase n=1 Tax=Sphingobium sp. TaxID=1912891 RepID=UPI002ED61D16